MSAPPSETSPRRHRYGPGPSQYGDLYLPAGHRRPGTVVLLHGGWWGPKYGAGNLDPAAADLAGRGWVVWNVEYRRLGLGGGYPSTLEDAAAALDYLAALDDAGTEPVVAIGHSAGGTRRPARAGTRPGGGAVRACPDGRPGPVQAERDLRGRRPGRAAA
jgi:acetyl esterase/lipase